MAKLTGEEALEAAAKDMDIMAAMLAGALNHKLITTEEVADLRPYIIAALYQRRVERGELDPR